AVGPPTPRVGPAGWGRRAGARDGPGGGPRRGRLPGPPGGGRTCGRRGCTPGPRVSLHGALRVFYPATRHCRGLAAPAGAAPSAERPLVRSTPASTAGQPVRTALPSLTWNPLLTPQVSCARQRVSASSSISG